ncbi:Sugar lactone lactonase YvrE [Rhodoferax sp. OV413]|uniref:SMP-30/gluconolactonase/LRE family protein n=1 Tax=Rhodoferax sp. OV413 TaxID=1855285 RepID=UPI00088C2149|nr:SMP-30/gluconolactonase/LRE family protein [Rhodoferax sp. OV413]SDP35685.1 Sugar lactone lactonase YvrE [Rhodoferax sp. OV413]
MSTAKAIASSRDRVGECPVWSVAENALYWVDIEGKQIRRWSPASDAVQSWTLPERVGCIALTPAVGRIVAAMETGVYVVQLGEAPAVQLDCLAAVTHPAPGMRFNDGRCDAQGRFWISTMVMDMGLASPLGCLYCLDEIGLSPARLDGLITPNGLAFSPDGATAYVSDSHPSVQKIWAFDFDAVSGELAHRRLFVDMQPLPGRPDGAAVDAEGCYWICANDAGLVHRFDPQGQLLASLEVPVAKPSMCAFGGANLDVLYVASIQPGTVDPAAPGLNGAVFALQPGVRGLPEPVFSRFPMSL